MKITIPMPKCVTNVNPTCTCELLPIYITFKNSSPLTHTHCHTVGLPSYDPVNCMYGNPNVTKISKSKLNCAILQGYWTTANSTVQKYKGCGCCQLNCAKVQRLLILQTQLCKSTKVMHAAISSVQSYRDIG